jgi:hypothetical protein
VNDLTPPSGVCSIGGCGKPSFCRGWCSAHYSRWQRHGDTATTKRHPPQTGQSERWCPKCGLYLPVEAFGIRTKTGRPKGYCKACEATYDAEYRSTELGAENKRRASRSWVKNNREYFLVRNYGLDLASYAGLLERQEGRCAICRTDRPGGGNEWMVVDHCHATKVVRGLLCVHCNLAIGQMADDPARLRAAADYLDRFK